MIDVSELPVLSYGTHVEGPRSRCGDVAWVAEVQDGLAILVADSASSGIACTAMGVYEVLRRGMDVLGDGLPPLDMRRILHEADLKIMDEHLPGDEACALVLRIMDNEIWGCGAGNCEAWMFRQGTGPYRLSDGVPRRPLIGSGSLSPHVFGPVVLLPGDKVVVATDGLWGIIKPQRAAGIVLGHPPDIVARLLAALATDAGAGLAEDIGIVCVEYHGGDEERRARPGGLYRLLCWLAGMLGRDRQ